MKKKGKDYEVDIYVDAQNIGFDITPEMADYENVVAFDLSGIKTNSDTLAINMQSEFLEKVVNNMGSDSIHVLTVYVLMFKTEVTKIKYSGKRGNTFIPLQKRPGGIIYYGLDDLSGKGHPFYCDSYYENLDEYFYKKDILRSVKFEIRTFKRPDGSNWTVAYTYPMFKKKIATHNSLTYSKPKHSMDNLYHITTTQCQTETIQQQYSRGVRMFDFRIRQDDGKLTAAHGNVEYTTNVEGNLKFLNERPGIIVRILLENLKKDGSVQYDWFRLTYADFEHKYSNIKFVNGRSKEGWDKLVGIADDPPGFTQYVWSRKWLIQIPTPKLYAKKQNKKNKENINYCTWSAFDFIEIDLGLESRK